MTKSIRSAILAAIMTLGVVSFSLAQSSTDQGKSGTAVRVIDNKGTIKYFQSNNGITQIVNTTNDKTTTTWQLGGTFIDNTTLDFGGKFFQFQNVILNTNALATSNGAVTTLATGSTAGTSGLTFLMRDEATGAIVKMLAADLIQSGQMVVSATADGTAPTIADATIPADLKKVLVFRNGAKLVAGTDYTVAAGAVTLVPGGTAPADWAIYKDDVFEVQWTK